jgi:hypothetical protein
MWLLRRWFFPQPWKESIAMASLESHYGIYRIVFRVAGRKFSRSLKTGVERVALAKLARLEENLGRLEQGDLVLPPGADLATFLLSDGRPEKPPKPKISECQTTGDLFDRFLATLNPESIESTTEHCIRIHVGHLRRELGSRRILGSVDFAALQEYIDKRSAAPGLNGITNGQVQVAGECHLAWSLPEILGRLPDAAAMNRQFVERGETLVILTRKQFLACARQHRHHTPVVSAHGKKAPGRSAPQEPADPKISRLPRG